MDSRAELPGRALACPGDFDQGDPRVPVGVPDLEAGLARVGRLFAGLFLGLVLVPGNRVRTWEGARRRPLRNLWPGVFAPFLKLSKDNSREDEILGGVNATESVGVRKLPAIGNGFTPMRPAVPPTCTRPPRSAFLLLGIGATLVNLWPRGDSGTRVAYAGGGLTFCDVYSRLNLRRASEGTPRTSS